jgi:hypothetical protein
MKRIFILGVALSIVSCSESAKVQKPTNLTSGGSVAFAELFGINEETAARDLPVTISQCLHRAHEDFSLALDGKEPRHAKSKGAYSDGGTSYWEDPCYTLVVFRQFSLICEKGQGLNGAIFGPELRFRPSMTRPELAPIARTRFVTMETGKIEGAEYSGCAP